MENWIAIDGVGINTAHLRSLKKEAAVKELAAAGGIPGSNAKEKEDWAKKAMDIISPKPEKQSPGTTE
jgi:hypothetical protein